MLLFPDVRVHLVEKSGCHPHLPLHTAGRHLVHPAAQDDPRRGGDRQPAGGRGGRLLLLSAQPLPVRGGKVGDDISNMSKVAKESFSEVQTVQ